MIAHNTSTVALGGVRFRPGELIESKHAARMAGFGVPVYMTHIAHMNAASTGHGWLVRVLHAAHKGLLAALSTQLDTRDMAFSLPVPGESPWDFSLTRATVCGRPVLVIGAR